jgi:hypothetical protein
MLRHASVGNLPTFEISAAVEYVEPVPLQEAVLAVLAAHPGASGNTVEQALRGQHPREAVRALLVDLVAADTVTATERQRRRSSRYTLSARSNHPPDREVSVPSTVNPTSRIGATTIMDTQHCLRCKRPAPSEDSDELSYWEAADETGDQVICPGCLNSEEETAIAEDAMATAEEAQELQAREAAAARHTNGVSRTT